MTHSSMKPKIQIPENLEQCFGTLKQMFGAEELEKICTGPESNMVRYHHGLGRWLRNNWGLWGESKLKEHLKKIGLWHADDMSSVILDSFWRHLHDVPLDIEEQVEKYQVYWADREE